MVKPRYTYEKMLKLKHTTRRSNSRFLTGGLAVALLGGGLYLLSLVAAPTIAPIVAMKPIDARELKEPEVGVNRIIIPKIGVDIPYGEGEVALDKGAQWRWPDRGNPEKGGNFIIAAHRFSIAPTPMETAKKSPFYHVEKLTNGDTILVDFDGKRYGYEINNQLSANSDQVEIEDPSETPKLTLYSCGLGGASDKRIVFTAKPLGEVSLTAAPSGAPRT